MATTKPIINRERYRTLKVLINGSDQDRTLAINIIDNCDIETSFLHLLALTSNSRNSSLAYGCYVGCSKNFVDYMKTLAPYLPFVNLEWILDMYKLHNEKQNLPEDNKEIKFLISEYQTEEKSSLFNFKPVLKAKTKKNG
jgi:hypothetical protein